jgi:DNA-binding NtrC family response regulator
LENALEALLAMSPNGELDLSLLPAPGVAAPGGGSAGDGDDPRVGLKQRVDAYERGLIVQALAAARNNRSHAARALGISRATLHEKLRKYGLAASGDEEPSSG